MDGGGGMEDRSMCRVSVQEDETAVEVDGGDTCTTLSMYFMPLNSIL